MKRKISFKDITSIDSKSSLVIGLRDGEKIKLSYAEWNIDYQKQKELNLLLNNCIM